MGDAVSRSIAAETIRRFAEPPAALPPRRVHRYAMGFRRSTGWSSRSQEWEGRPDAPFRPSGLIVFGVTAETLITDARVGHQPILKIGAEPLPGLVFAVGYSFGDFIKMLEIDERTELGEEVSFFRARMKREPGVKPHQIFDCPTCGLGERVVIRTTGPLEALAVWGLAELDG